MSALTSFRFADDIVNKEVEEEACFLADRLDTTTTMYVQNEPPRDKTNKMACAPSEGSDQPGHPPSLIRVFAMRSMGS